MRSLTMFQGCPQRRKSKMVLLESAVAFSRNLMSLSRVIIFFVLLSFCIRWLIRHYLSSKVRV